MANAPPIPELVPIPDGYRRIAREEVTPAMLNFARIAESNKLPIGKLQSSLIEGQHVAALTDWHYTSHRNRNGRKHWHPAISLLVQKSLALRPAPQWSADHRPPPPPPPGPLQSGNSPGPLQSGDSPGPLQAQATVTASASSPALSQIAAVVKAAPAIVSTAKSAVNALSDLNLSGSIDVSADMDLTENLDAAGDSDVETAAEFGGGKRPRKRHR